MCTVCFRRTVHGWWGILVEERFSNIVRILFVFEIPPFVNRTLDDLELLPRRVYPRFCLFSLVLPGWTRIFVNDLVAQSSRVGSVLR